jgi:protoheme IX farnesyltransferase
MNLRPTLSRSIAPRDASTVCLRCWKRLAGSPNTMRHPFSSISSRKQGSIAIGKSRNSFSKDYFWANTVLRETFGKSRRELQSSIAADRSRAGEQAAREDAIAAPEQVLPHRRRKKAKEQAEEDSETAYPIAHDASSKLAAISSSLPQRSIKRLFTTYLSLSKPRLSFLVVLTATAAYSIYPVPQLLAPAATATPSLSTHTLLPYIRHSAMFRVSKCPQYAHGAQIRCSNEPNAQPTACPEAH